MAGRLRAPGSPLWDAYLLPEWQPLGTWTQVSFRVLKAVTPHMLLLAIFLHLHFLSYTLKGNFLFLCRMILDGVPNLHKRTWQIDFV